MKNNILLLFFLAFLLAASIVSSAITSSQGELVYDTTLHKLSVRTSSTWETVESYKGMFRITIDHTKVSGTNANFIYLFSDKAGSLPPENNDNDPCSGGTKTRDGDYIIRTFTGNGTLSCSAPVSADILVVGGGGGGGNNIGGGGGAGGFRTTTSSLSAGGYGIQVGSGGAGGTQAHYNGYNGTDSIFDTGGTAFTSTGGGGGGGAFDGGAAGLDGGCGGGADLNNTTGHGHGNTPATSPSQGNDGGDGSTYSGYSGGGGGGKGAAGSNGPGGGTGGDGGNGAEWPSGSGHYYAGGGGGGGYQGTGGVGKNGGGNGGYYPAAPTGITATSNTGSGGGGGGAGYGNGGAGGSGVVIMRYYCPRTAGPNDNFWTYATAQDIRFFNTDGKTELKREIVSFDGVNHSVEAWVQIPSLSSGSDKVIYCQYGGVTKANDPTLWTDAGYLAVYHLQDAANPTSSTGQNNGTNYNSTVSTGKIGAGAYFNNSTTYMELTNNTLTSGVGSQLSVTAWVNPLDDNKNGLLSYRVDLGSSGGAHTFWNPCSRQGAYHILYYDSAGSGWRIGTSSAYVMGQWTYEGWTIDGTTLNIYGNGSPDGSPGLGATFDVSANPYIEIGRVNWYAGDENGYGTFDEIRIANVVLSANQIATEYNNQYSPSTFSTCSNI